MTTFATELRTQRIRDGWSMSKLGRATGLNTSAISRMEAGNRHPTCESVMAIADALRVSPIERDRMLYLAGYAPASKRVRAMIEEMIGVGT